MVPVKKRSLLALAAAAVFSFGFSGLTPVGLLGSTPALAFDQGRPTATPDLADLAYDKLGDASYGPRPNVAFNPSGAMGVNAKREKGETNEFFIEEQRHGATYVQLGLVRARPEWRQQGWNSIEWGLSQQSPDGSFPSTRYGVHSESMFIEAASRALLIEHEVGAPGPHDVAKAGIVAGARWLASRDPRTDRELIVNADYTHRFFIMACALGNAGELANDPQLKAAAESYAMRGIAKQRPDGVNPEKGGFDVGYQATGIVYQARYYAVTRNSALKQQLRAAIARGATWLASRVGPDGTVDSAGSTRILSESGHDQRVKGVPYGLVIEALALAAYVTQDQTLRAKADAVQRSQAFAVYYLPRSDPARALAKMPAKAH